MYQKKLSKTIMILAALLVFSAAAPLLAADDQKSMDKKKSAGWQQSSAQRSAGKSMLCTANDLIGSDVKSGTPGMDRGTMGTRGWDKTRADQNDPNRAGQQQQTQRAETIGTVEELIIDDNQDKVHYVLVEADDKFYPVPMWAFDVSANRSASSMRTNDATGTGAGAAGYGSAAATDRDRKSTLYLNISKDQFKQAPSVESDSLSSFDDTNLQQRIDSFYSQHIPGKSSAMRSSQQRQSGMQTGTQTGTQPGTQAGTQSSTQSGMQTQGGQAKHMKASEVIGIDIKDNANKDLGEIEDLVIDTRQGHLAYGLVSFGGFMDIGDKTAAVPWQSININIQDKTATVNATDAQLKAAVIEKDNLQRLSQPEFARQIHSTFGAQPYWEVFGFAPGEDANKPMDHNKPMDPNKNNQNGQKQNNY